MKKAVVTGANGFVGRYLIEQLTDLGYEIWAIVREESEDISFLFDGSPHIVFCDLDEIETLPDKLTENVSGSCFYHLAWAGSSGEAHKDYELQMQNAVACAKAARVAKLLGCVRFVGAGSVAELIYRDYLLQDGANPEPVAFYAIGKITAEYLARCVCSEEGIEYNWTYISNIYGVRDQSDNFINWLIRNYLEGKTPELTAGEQYADFVYVSDVAGALIAVGERGSAGSTYYIGYGKPRPLQNFVLDVRNMVAPHLDTGLGRKDLLALPINFSKINLRKLRQDTGFCPQISFLEGLKFTADWMKIKVISEA